MEVLIVIGIMLTLVGTLAYFDYRSKRKRTAAMREAADALGFEFVDAHTGFTPGAGGGRTFYLYDQGHSKETRNLIRGTTAELSVSVVDYQYKTGSGKHQSFHPQTVVCLSSEGLDLPAFGLRPMTFSRTLATLFGYKDIDFEGYPAFNKAYLLRGPDEERVRGLFTTDVLEFFESATGWNVDACGPIVLVYKEGVLLKPEEIRDAMAHGFEVLNRLEAAAREGAR